MTMTWLVGSHQGCSLQRSITPHRPKTITIRSGSSIIPTQAEINLKNDALACYKSQLKIEGVWLNHFEMVRGKPEYLNDTPYSWRALDA